MTITMSRNHTNEAFNSAGAASATAYVETTSPYAVAPAVQPPDGAGALQLHTKEAVPATVPM